MTNPEKKEIIDIVKSEIKNFAQDTMDKEVKKILQNKSSQSRKELIDTIKNSLESAFKVLWIKRDFWKTDIK